MHIIGALPYMRQHANVICLIWALLLGVWQNVCAMICKAIYFMVGEGSDQPRGQPRRPK